MMHIAFGIDYKFVMPCGVTMVSICENNKSELICFHVLTPPDFPEKGKDVLRNIAIGKYGKNIEFHGLTLDMLKGCSYDDKGYNSVLAVYYRFLLATVLPNEPKVLYLDSDIIVRHGLSELWNTDIQGCAVAACVDKSCDDIRLYNALGYDMSIGYFNSGVMLINLDYWRRHDVLNRLLSYSYEHQNLLFKDQDPLNFVLRKEKKTIGIKFNLQEDMLIPKQFILLDRRRFEEMEQAIKDPVIIHYSSSLKPWYSDCVHPYRGIWLKYLAMTEWVGVRMKARYPKAVLVRLVRNMLGRLNLCRTNKSKFRTDIPHLDS